jgi:hypothetical protein
LILLIFTGLLEELIFRGLLQYAAIRVLRGWGVAYVAVLFAVLHLGYRSAYELLLVFAVALLYGFIALRTGSILGVSLSHGLTNISLYLIFPLLLAATPNPLPSLEGLLPSLTSPTTPAPVLVTTQVPPTPLPPTATQQPVATSTSTEPSPTSTPTPQSTATPIYQFTNTPISQSTNTPIPPPTNTPSPQFTITPIYQSSTLPSLALSPVEGFQSSGILVDDGDPGFTHTGGQPVSDGAAINGDLLLASTSLQTGGDVQAQWSPALSTCGRYEVQVYIPAGYAATRSADYQLAYRYGMLTKRVDQSAQAGEWVSLGEYDFLPTKGTYLRLTNATSEDPALALQVLFDAARWILQIPCN